jgi:hypothetical protein
MTSNILPDPFVAYASTQYDDGWAAWKAFQGTTTTAWATAGGLKAGWLLLQLDAARVIDNYIIKAHPSYYTLAPKDFTLQGSNIVSPMNMTANTTGSYIASASTTFDNAENRKAWNAFGSNADPWASGGSVNTGWLKIDLNTGKTVVGYAVKAHHLWYTGAPNDFTLQGSNNDIDWTTLDTQTDQVFSAAETKTYTFSNSTSYRYYKLDVTQNNGGSEVVVGEVYLFSTNWTTLDSQTNQTFDGGNPTRTYSFSNSTPYTHFKLDVTDITAVSGELTVGELELRNEP